MLTIDILNGVYGNGFMNLFDSLLWVLRTTHYRISGKKFKSKFKKKIVNFVQRGWPLAGCVDPNYSSDAIS